MPAQSFNGPFSPLGRTHDPAALLRQALATNRFAEPDQESIERLAVNEKLMGRDIHIKSDYGDEAGWQTPWDLFDAADAQEALAIAEDAVNLARSILPDLEECHKGATYQKMRDC